MSDREWELYLEAAEVGVYLDNRSILRSSVGSPCYDCLPAFYREMLQADRCDGRPGARLQQTPERRSWNASAARRRDRLSLAVRPA